MKIPRKLPSLKLRSKKPTATGRQRPTSSTAPRQQVFSYYASQRQSSRRPSATPMRRREEARNPSESFDWRRIPTVIAIAIIIICMMYASTLSGTPKIHVRVAVSGEAAAQYRSQTAYQEIATDALQGSMFNKSKFTIQREAIAAYIQSRLPEVTEVRVATPLVSRNLVVAIDTTTPALIVQAPNVSFVVDETGVVITTLNQAPAVAGRDLPVVADQTDTQVSLGKPLLSTQEVAMIRSLYKELIALKMPPASMKLPKGIASELHVTFKDQPYFVKFALNGDARMQVGTYVALKENLAKQGTIAGEYIDVRVEGRAYYR